MKVIVISDLHGVLPEINEFDLLLICGDVCPVKNHKTSYQYNWLINDFSNWINHLPFRNTESKVVMIAGNHDFVFEENPHELPEILNRLTCDRLVYLNNSGYNFQGIKIWGTPYCKQFFNWAFMRDNEVLHNYYSDIPDDLDILISHDAADLNDLGMIKMGQWTGTNAGNTVLSEWILDKKPKYYFCGHIHSGNHTLTELNGIKMANVSVLNEYYNESYKPLEFEL